MTQSLQSKKLCDTAARLLPGFLKTAPEAMENFPYPPGEDYRSTVDAYRKSRDKFMQAARARMLERKQP